MGALSGTAGALGGHGRWRSRRHTEPEGAEHPAAAGPACSVLEDAAEWRCLKLRGLRRWGGEAVLEASRARCGVRVGM